MANKYREYFDIDERYFPCIDESAINAGAPWENTYPHQAFIGMLTEMERALSRQNNGKTLWVEGAYGTGKSQCVYALRKILEVSEEELRAYWDKYEPLKKKSDLLEKLIAHKKKTIVVAHRFASGGIMSSRDLFFAIQESIKSALVRQNVAYLGENTLKESIIAWLEDPDHKLMFDSLLQNPDKEWKASFSQSAADEVLSALYKGGEIKFLVNNIFRLADKEGITALSIDSDRLINWLTDIIDRNNTKIVLIWDEFSDYFKNNRESLSEFQKIAALVQQKPFYFIVVTHEPQQIYVSDNDRGNQVKVSDRFISMSITLPDNIAFDLIGHAFDRKPAAKSDWDIWADDLNEHVKDSRAKVMAAAKIDDPQVMKNIMPLHPMAALLLKNIASAFKSNQRSMFDFIKSPNLDDVKAFQWFIENTGPHDDHPLLTVDMLWNFFYEKGRDDLAPDIRLILDVLPQQHGLRDDEITVLKAILIMQAIDLRLGGAIDLFKATEQNLGYVFEGIPDLEGTKSANLAKGLRDKGVLVTSPIGGGKTAYVAAVLAGDHTKIDNHRKELRQSTSTSKLITEGELATVLSLPPALALRFESEPGTGKLITVTTADFIRTIRSLRDRDNGWQVQAVIAFAKDEAEASSFRKTLKAAVADKQYENIVFIDALSTPFGPEAFEQYLEFSAMAMYYRGNNNNSARENSDKAKRLLDQDWKNRINNGQFIVYTYANQAGEKLNNGDGIASILQRVVTNRFPLIQSFDFVKGLTVNHFKLTQGKNSATYGITGKVKSSPVNGIEKQILPALSPSAWEADRYWENQATASLPISKIKLGVDRYIDDSLGRDGQGQISIGAIYDFLEETYGFATCNLSAFIAGFLLKEYSIGSFRYSDSSGSHEQMTPDKLAEMLGNYIGKPSAKPAYIVKMTPEERAFYELTEKGWGIKPNSCSSVGQAASAVAEKMRGFGLPIWALEEVDSFGIYDVVYKYIELVQKEGPEAHSKAIEIGKVASARPDLTDNLPSLVTSENCKKGMTEFLKSFEEGQLLEQAKAIGAESNVLVDIRSLFTVKYSCLWDKQTGKQDVLRKLLTDYSLVKESNAILSSSAHSLTEAYEVWREHLKFIGISCEALKGKFPILAETLDMCLRICQRVDIFPDQLNTFHSELVAHGDQFRELINNDNAIFAKIYEPYLEGLSNSDIAEIKSKLQTGLFQLSKTDCNAKVKDAAEEFRKSQLKSQLLQLWKEKTKTKNPRDWSSRFRVPILCCVSEVDFEKARKAFDILNKNWGTDAEIKKSLTFLKNTSLFDDILDEGKREAAFRDDIIGEYSTLLPDLEKVREALDHISIDVYDWRDNPSIKARVEQLAKAEYDAGGSDKVLLKIDEMDEGQLKPYLKRLVKDSITVGIEILANKGEKQNEN